MEEDTTQQDKPDNSKKKSSEVSSIEDFTLVVNAVKDFIEADELTIRITSSEGVLRARLVVDEDTLNSKIQSLEIETGVFKGILNEISFCINEVFLPLRGRSLTVGPLKLELPEVSDDKINLVEDSLITRDIRDEYILKTTSKGRVLDNRGWEINKKEYDSQEGDLSSLKYATIHLTIVHNPTFFPFGKGENLTPISFDCSPGDLKELIDELGEIRERLMGKE